ncbi:hypothetical protein [Nocardia seriolae]|uniref:hypothetical protein n=1 Tax=Nocardia seriolae TaxID=37332 RepID=UPI000AD40CF7|nr:hypothetical protein [Nocardia seriolae]QOW36048.1 hypothetical protein IMZ23_14820 [Nocardia seriolae]WNJ56482.1 hypothetical protein RMO66_23615 [Nocardia seriolae]
MAVRLAFGIGAGRDRRAWLVETGEEIAHDGPAGAAVVLRERDSDAARVAIACADLAGLMELGGPVIAGAGIDLGDGFTSARLAGASGDRRDAVLAALRVLRVGGAWRLGERTATLVALFGVTATKPVGAAAEQAMGEGRWAAVVLASAAANLLGPEQLVRVLALTAPEDVDPISDAVPSALAENLGEVLESFTRPRRLELLLDLWERVCAGQTAELMRRRLAASHDLSVVAALGARYRHFDEAEQMRTAGISEPTLITALHFEPTWEDFWRYTVERRIEDALAATVLLKTAIAVHECGIDAGLARVREEITVVSTLSDDGELERACRLVAKQSPLPARPACRLRDIDLWLRQHRPRNAAFEKLVRVRISTALAYATVVYEACERTFGSELSWRQCPDGWDSDALRAWRKVAGYTAPHTPATWLHEPLTVEDPAPSLAQRLAADAGTRELASDMLWMADLADAIARARGHAAAEIDGGFQIPCVVLEPDVPRPEPLTPRVDSIPLAVAGAAQLLALGATAPARCRDWNRLCAGLMSSGTVAQTLSNEFVVAEPVLAYEGAVLPGTAFRIQIARNAGRLAEWSDYMGNCIAGPWYQAEAVRGRSILVAIRDESDVIRANVELRAVGARWVVDEIKARFNNEPDSALLQAVRDWAGSLRAAEPEVDPMESVNVEPPVRNRRSGANPVREVGPLLREAARKAQIESESALRELAALAGDTEGDAKTLTALRRSSIERSTLLCVEALDGRPSILPRLWAATGVRPLAAAVEALDPGVLARYPRLRGLTADAPLPSQVLRTLAKDPDIAAARNQDRVAHRIRAILARLARTGDASFTAALTRHPTPDLLCPLVLATTAASRHRIPVSAITGPGADVVPGFPATSLSDSEGPWAAAWPAALELGTDKAEFADQFSRTGLLVPAAWLGAGGWPALWSRAHLKQRARRAPGRIQQVRRQESVPFQEGLIPFSPRPAEPVGELPR